MYNVPLLPMTRFNNSINMGSFIISLILCPVLFFAFRIMIFRYQATVAQRLETTRAWKFIKATKFYIWYKKYDELYGA